MPGYLANIWWGLILLGLCAGLISGTLGLGSGTILIPAMVLLFAFPQKSAQATALAVMVPMALTGALLYWRDPQVDLRLPVVAMILAGALLGAVVGATLARHLPAHLLRKVFALFLLAVALKMLLAPAGPRQPSPAKATAADVAAAPNHEGIADDTTSGSFRK